MKKLLAIVLILMTMGLLPTEKPRAELYIFHQFDSSLEESSVKLDYSQEEMFLIEFLEKSSWQQISLLAKKVSNPNNIEDCFLVQLIQEINSPKSSYSYNDYVDSLITGIPANQIDFSVFMDKVQIIINSYNHCINNTLKLIWTSDVNDGNLQIKISSTNAITDSATYLGQSAILKDGSTYWESSLYGGTGKYGTATKANKYLSDIVTVNGVAYYSDDNLSDLITFYYLPYEDVKNIQKISVDTKNIRMLHVCTQDSDLGWVHPGAIIALD